MKKAIVAVPFLKGTGGTETVIKNFSQALEVRDNKYGISWKLISLGGSEDSEWLAGWNKKIYRFSRYRYIQLIAYISIMPYLIFKILKDEKPDFFIATNPVIWSIAYKFRKNISPKTKIIAWYHYSFKMKKVKKRYLKKADYFWAISSGIKDELISLEVPAQKIKLIYNPVNTIGSRLVKRSGNKNNFIYIGRADYSYQKNVSELIKALNCLKGHWHFSFYGDIRAEVKKKLLQLSTPKVRKNITFKGYYENIWNHINVADAIVLTSKFEGLPMVLIESGIRGIELISSDCPMGPKDIINEENGYLYSSGNFEELSTLLQEIIDKKTMLKEPQKISDSMNIFSYEEYRKRVLGSFKSWRE